ncbi:hypothetical protein F3Y22_tig00110383pilonHSYRG00107 [Hibiscus syriacus]|uniref:Pentatricopeptide repeat-containing protein n=1 Tax=Hibiscus syriacus TaxID=106335 RepID=A0A6A3AXL1_HIBSY|nr:hypothetical protein F3Y22_tig00110383pilonHSYRG00107 [Hibiscus syriacus]
MSASPRRIRYLNYQTRNLRAIASIEVSIVKLHKLYAHVRHSLEELPRMLNLPRMFPEATFKKHGLSFVACIFSGCDLDAYTFTPVLSACSALPGTEHGKQVHGLMIKTGVDAGTISKTALMNLYSKYGCLSDSVKAFEEIELKDIAPELGKQIHGLVVVFDRDLVILSTALIDFDSDMGRVTEALKVFSTLCDITDDTQLCNALLDMYAKCGKILYARRLFDGISKKCVVSWTSMIDACGRHGYGIEALELFKLMEVSRNGVMPNSVTFLVLLYVCGHSGLVEEGQKCFNLMREKHGLDLNQEHYASFIDVLGQAGRIDKAWSLLDDMIKNGTRPTTAIWIALLNASNLVLLSNLCAAVGKWDSVDKLRDIMKKKGLNKEVGSSRVIVKPHNGTGIIGEISQKFSS